MINPYLSPSQAIQDDLKNNLATAIYQQPLKAILDRCITLYMEYLFPIAPIVCEDRIRSSVQTFGLQLETEAQSPQSSFQSDPERLSQIRNWTLLSALCAATAFLLPSSLFPERDLLGRHFLRASRDMLRLYHDSDIEQPDYTSLAVRYYHSNALHAVGKTRVSWHVLGEAVRLTQEMRLFDEQAYCDVEPVEAHLRRNTFWQIHTADKSAAILNNYPIALHKICLGGPITTLYPHRSGLLHPLPASSSSVTTEDTPDVATGFNLCQDLWMRASDLVLRLDAMRILWNSTGRPGFLQEIQEAITCDHLRFVGILDELRIANLSAPTTPSRNGHAVTQLGRVGNIQRANLLVTFHCLRLVLLQKFTENGCLSLLGISEDAVALALRKSEIASDMIQVLKETPLECLQINGEPCVSYHTSFHLCAANCRYRLRRSAELA